MSLAHNRPNINPLFDGLTVTTFDPEDTTNLLWLEEGGEHHPFLRMYGRVIPDRLRVDLDFIQDMIRRGYRDVLVAHRTEMGWNQQWLANYLFDPAAAMLRGEIVIDRRGDTWLIFDRDELQLYQQPERRRRARKAAKR